jgi:hypothetical protein
MGNDFVLVMQSRSDDELIRIVTTDRENYQPIAIEAAEIEFKKRNLPADLIEKVKKETLSQDMEEIKRSIEPLAISWKILTFFFPGIINIIVSEVLHSGGYTRKSAELSRWTVFGLLFYAAIIILLVYLS